MKIGYKTISACVIGFLFSIIMPAQDLPEFPADDSISHGALPNGMSYYIVENGSAAGMADFALVRKKSFDGSTDLRDNVIRMEDVMISYSSSVLDSTLLSIFKAADAYSPVDQAVIVSGDVSGPAVAEKLRMLSYMTPVKDSAARVSYVWKEHDSLSVRVSEYGDRELATVRATWYSPRTEPRYMPTVQPAIYSLFVAEMGNIACDRIERCFRQAGIPSAGAAYEHYDSSHTHGDDAFSVAVSVSPSHLDDAVRILSYVMSSLDSGSATVQEVERAHDKVLRAMYDDVRRPLKSNSDYMDRCIAAFLYNGSLAADRQIYDFHSSRSLDGQTELSLFNGIASALLDGERNVVLEVRTSSEADPERLSGLFRKAWGMSSTLKWKDRPVTADFLSAADPGSKVKIPAARKELLSGGSIWTLPDGMIVVSKNVPAEKRIYYSFVFRYGYAHVPDLKTGEGAYVGDYLRTCRIAGVPAEDFFSALAAEGVMIDVSVSMTDVEIKGSAPENDLEKVLQAITAIIGNRRRDDEALGYYRSKLPVIYEDMKGSEYRKMAAIGALLCPDYKMSSIKSLPELSEGFGNIAENFFTDCFSKAVEAVFVISGDTDDDEIRKLFSLYLPGLRSGNDAIGRPDVRFRPISGVTRSHVEGNEPSVDLAITARIPLTVENYAASLIAEQMIRQSLAKEFKGTVWRPSVVSRYAIFPDERFSMVLSLDMKRTGESEPLEAVSMLDSAFSEIASSEIDEEHLNAVRNLVKSRQAALRTFPEYLNEIISSRILYGKDLYTDFDSKADSVTAQKVRDIISSLDEGGKVEYIVTEQPYVSRNYN